MLPLAHSNQEIVRLDVTMQVQSGVDVLNTLDHLVGEHQDGFEGEDSVALAEEFL